MHGRHNLLGLSRGSAAGTTPLLIPYPGGRRTCGNEGSTTRCGLPVRPRVSNATGVAAAEDAGPCQAGGGGIARRAKRCRGPALQDGPKFFEKVADDVMLDPRYASASSACWRSASSSLSFRVTTWCEGHRDARGSAPIAASTASSGGRLRRRRPAARNAQRGANGFGVLGHDRSRLRPCRFESPIRRRPRYQLTVSAIPARSRSRRQSRSARVLGDVSSRRLGCPFGFEGSR